MDQISIDHMWNAFRQENPNAPEKYEAWAFGNSEEMADELAALVLAGKKTATASNYRMYQLEEEALPYIGLHNIILNGAGLAVAVMETTSVAIIPFDEVTAEHAYLEGEGDRSLSYWRDVHEAFFTAELSAVDEAFHDKLPIVCERLKLVYPK